MTYLKFLFYEWSNVIYVAPLLIAMLYFSISFVLGGGFDAGDADVDVDVDADVDIDADIDVDADVDAGSSGHSHSFSTGDETEFFADGDADAHADVHGAEHASQPGALAKFFIFMGIGRVPFSLIWSAFFMSWGLAGITCNTIMYMFWGKTFFYKFTWFASIPVAFFVALTLTKGVVQLWIKFLPTHAPTASKPKDLIGSRGTVLSETITKEHGRARITDSFGFSLDIFCKLHPTCHKKLKHGDRIMVIDIVPGQNYYFIGPFDE